MIVNLDLSNHWSGKLKRNLNGKSDKIGREHFNIVFPLYCISLNPLPPGRPRHVNKITYMEVTGQQERNIAGNRLSYTVKLEAFKLQRRNCTEKRQKLETIV